MLAHNMMMVSGKKEQPFANVSFSPRIFTVDYDGTPSVYYTAYFQQLDISNIIVEDDKVKLTLSQSSNNYNSPPYEIITQRISIESSEGSSISIDSKSGNSFIFNLNYEISIPLTGFTFRGFKTLREGRDDVGKYRTFVDTIYYF